MKILAIASLCMALGSCNDDDWKIPVGSHEVMWESSKVELRETEGKWELVCNGVPMYVKGAATNNYFTDVAKFGGNTIRTYSAAAGDLNTTKILNDASKSGLFVNVGLAISKKTSSFDYKKEEKVREQFDAAIASVRKYKDHPAVLFWSIGNEAESKGTSDEFWKAINDIAAKIHEIDPNHPVATTLASAGKEHFDNIMAKCPALDFVCINSYYPTVFETCSKVKGYGWDKPIMITEYGPRGTWNMNPEPDRILPWDGPSEGPSEGKGALIEETSTEKELRYQEIYEALEAEKGFCLGSFAFVWGYQRHGEVLNWYGLHNKDRYSYGAVDVLQYCWTGEWPEQRAPRIESRNDMTMNGLTADKAITVAPGSANTAKVVASSPAEINLTYEWIIFREGDASANDSLPDGIEGLIEDGSKPEIAFRAPEAAGAYRLYVFAKDDVNRKVASACIPFLVK